jgi:hypothetical protein
MMVHTATLIVARWPDAGPFYFVSDDGETFYEVNGLSPNAEDYDRIRPFSETADGKMLRMGMDRRWLQMQASDGGSVKFETVA